MATVGPVAGKLRAFVKARVRKEGTHYARGNASRLAEYLGVDPSWVTEYTDDPPRNHADIDTAISICDFYGVSLEDFARGRVRTVPQRLPTNPLIPAAAEAIEKWPLAQEQLIVFVNTLRQLAGLPAISPASARRRGRRA